MNDTPLQLTKRELHSSLTSRITWIALVAAGVCLGLAAPFGTDTALTTLPRIAYWLTVVVVGYGLGAATTTFAKAVMGQLGLPRWPAATLAGLACGLVNLAALIGLNWLVFRLSLSEPGYLWSLGPNVIVISIVVSVSLSAIGDMVQSAAPPDASEPPRPTAPPRILDRLPLDKRGALIALSVQDHYVQVTTTRGTELILLRLSDAMAEVGETPGLQVHRSHWVAIHAVTAARRDGARAILTLTTGVEIPVSRTYLPAIREAGLLPK